MKVFIPREAPISHLVDASTSNGRTYAAQQDENGKAFLDIPPLAFRRLLRDRQNGLLWERANPEALVQLATFKLPAVL
jgi:hypothetical protein